MIDNFPLFKIIVTFTDEAGWLRETNKEDTFLKLD